MLFFVFEQLPILSSENLHNCTFMCLHAQQTHSEALVEERFRTKGPVTKGTYNGFAHPELRGLCDQWVNPDTGELIRTAAIVTTQAKGIMREIHNSKVRMPVVLSESEETDWLAGSSVRPEITFEAISI